MSQNRWNLRQNHDKGYRFEARIEARWLESINFEQTKRINALCYLQDIKKVCNFVTNSVEEKYRWDKKSVCFLSWSNRNRQIIETDPRIEGLNALLFVVCTSDRLLPCQPHIDLQRGHLFFLFDWVIGVWRCLVRHRRGDEVLSFLVSISSYLFIEAIYFIKKNKFDYHYIKNLALISV